MAFSSLRRPEDVDDEFFIPQRSPLSPSFPVATEPSTSEQPSTKFSPISPNYDLNSQGVPPELICAIISFYHFTSVSEFVRFLLLDKRTKMYIEQQEPACALNVPFRATTVARGDFPRVHISEKRGGYRVFVLDDTPRGKPKHPRLRTMREGALPSRPYLYVSHLVFDALLMKDSWDRFFSNIPNVTHLSLRYAGPPVSFAGLVTPLRSLSLYQCDVTDSTFETDKLRSVRKLHLQACGNCSLTTKMLSSFPTLEKFELEQFPSGFGWNDEDLGNCPLKQTLKKLYLNHVYCRGFTPNSFKGFVALEVLELRRIMDVPDDTIRGVVSSRNLRKLIVAKCTGLSYDFDGESLRPQFPQLEQLEVRPHFAKMGEMMEDSDDERAREQERERLLTERGERFHKGDLFSF